MRYLITSDRDSDVLVDGLGIVGPGETLVEAPYANMFRHVRGLSLAQVNMPEGLEVTIVLDEEGE